MTEEYYNYNWESLEVKEGEDKASYIARTNAAIFSQFGSDEDYARQNGWIL